MLKVLLKWGRRGADGNNANANELHDKSDSTPRCRYRGYTTSNQTGSWLRKILSWRSPEANHDKSWCLVLPPPTTVLPSIIIPWQLAREMPDERSRWKEINVSLWLIRCRVVRKYGKIEVQLHTEQSGHSVTADRAGDARVSPIPTISQFGKRERVGTVNISPATRQQLTAFIKLYQWPSESWPSVAASVSQKLKISNGDSVIGFGNSLNSLFSVPKRHAL